MSPQTREKERTAYAATLEVLSDGDFVEECSKVCWFSAFANNNPRAPAHWQADLLIDESERRAKPWLYAQGRNKAILSCGLEPTDSDLEAAKVKEVGK